MNFEESKPLPEKEPEKIITSAIRFQKRIFTGNAHIDALMNLEEEFPEWSREKNQPEDGFITSSGRFVFREEAGEIAKKASQLDHLTDSKRIKSSEYLDAHDLEELRPKWDK